MWTVKQINKHYKNTYNGFKSTKTEKIGRKLDMILAQKPRNADYTKEYNRKAVLRILRNKTMSRAELARATGLTRAAGF